MSSTKNVMRKGNEQMKIGFDNDKYLKMQSEHIRERINQFVNSILQIKPFVTGEFVKLHINFIGFIERYAQPDTIFTISQLI